ncbi:MAG TPA: hypothetical protein DCS93_26040 [Microscillaceae bacterium]|nr:hypothetical protein [Microscillaceae bacterium]
MINRLIQILLLFRNSNVKVIVVCLFLSTLLWFTLELNKEQSIEVSYPVEFQYNDSLFIPTTPLPEDIRILIKGTGWQVLSKYFGLSGSAVQYDIDNLLRSYVDYAKGGTTFILPASSQNQAKLRKSLEDVELQGIVADTLHLAFDRRIRRTLPLSIYHERSLAEDYQIDGEVTIEPKYVIFDGPEKIIKGLADPFVLDLPEKNISGKYNNKVSIALPESQAKLIVQDKSSARVSFDVAKYITKTMRLPVQKRGFPEAPKLAISQPQTTLTFKFKEADLGKVRLKSFAVFADFDRLNPTDSTLKLRLRRPNFIENYQLLPDKIKLTNLENKKP